jgi:hypothetical protein
MNTGEKLGVFGVIAGVVGIGYAWFVNSKINDLNDALKASVDKISGEIKVDISEAIVEKAVNKAVEREVDRAVRKVSYEVMDTINRDIRSKVKSSVESEYSSIRAYVSKEVSKTVANLDMEVLRNDVREQAKDLVVEKFNENLDSLLQDFNQNLTNVSKIYSSIADTMTKSSKETVVKIGG